MADAASHEARRLWRSKRVRAALAWCAGLSLFTLVGSCFGSMAVESWHGATIYLGEAALWIQHVPGDASNPTEVHVQQSAHWPRWTPHFSYRPYQYLSNSATGSINRPHAPDNALTCWLPLWPVPLVFGVSAIWAHRRVRRLSAHTCQSCGYDTRGLAAGACCPECGTACTV